MKPLVSILSLSPFEATEKRQEMVEKVKELENVEHQNIEH